MKLGDKVIDQKTAEIGKLVFVGDICELEGEGGYIWQANYNDLKLYDTNPDSKSCFEELCQSMIETYKRKNADYGNSFDKSIDRYGNVAFLTRISDKFNRAENLLLNGNAQVTDEKVTDTLMDLANYCIMMVAYLKNKNNNG